SSRVVGRNTSRDRAAPQKWLLATSAGARWRSTHTKSMDGAQLMAPQTGDLDRITTFPRLIEYLRDELDWPVDAGDFDDLTFEFKPHELGLKDAAEFQ